jgi:hypothetical protein
LIGRVAQLERRRRKNNIVITGWKQVKERVDQRGHRKFYKRKQRGS